MAKICDYGGYTQREGVFLLPAGWGGPDPVAEFRVEMPATRMSHADSVADGLVLDLDLVVGRIDGAWRTGLVRESDGDAHGTRDAGGEVRAVEVRRPPLGNGTAFGRG